MRVVVSKDWKGNQKGAHIRVFSFRQYVTALYYVYSCLFCVVILLTKLKKVQSWCGECSATTSSDSST